LVTGLIAYQFTHCHKVLKSINPNHLL